MNVREWALVAFSLLVQTSVGVLLVVAAVQPSVARGEWRVPGRGFEMPLLVAAAAAGVALVASLAHLGQPLHAWLAAINVRSSWLSREIVLALSFTAAVSLFALMARADIGSTAGRGTVRAVAVLLGAATIYAMSRLYMVPAQPAWNRAVTPLGFFATALVIGTLVVLVTSTSPGLLAGTDPVAAPFVRLLLFGAIALLAVQLLLLPAQFAAVAGDPAAAVGAAAAGHLAAWLAATRAVLAVAAVLMLVAALRSMPGELPAGALSLAFVLTVMSEVAGRLLFYASSVRI